ncbi:hypothetical protein ACHAXA_004329 [Cyclostephanos tholiformis]|uniref:Uncharacterized protein n=1 Tax=Cyclostephanos tholiformis TaxID=382380 RepID=A0ABD3SQF0_9STRA
MITIQRIASSALALKRTSESDSSDTEGGSPNDQQPGRRTSTSKNIIHKVSSENGFPSKYLSEEESFDADAFFDKRVMTPNQERFNAITMIPGMIYSVYFILAGCWIKAGDDQHDDHPFHQSENSDWSEMAREAFGSENGWRGSFGCIRSSSFPHLTALPPLPVVAAAVGILVHSPFSIMYHWSATSIEPSYRIKHWSRRLDHAFIHFASACAAYATSGRVDFFLLNAAFNLDCAYRQFEEKVCPKRNLNRVASSVFLYLLPVLMHKQYLLFFQFFLCLPLLFVQYPLGGWSHGVFHLVLSCLPHLIMKVATQLESSQLQINLAVKCAAVAGQL